MSDTAQKEIKAQPIKGKEELWRVTVRHTPLRADHKKRLVTATSKESAWTAFLAELKELIIADNYKSEPSNLPKCQAWLKEAKKLGIPDDAEIAPDEYLKRRMDAMRIRGTVRREDVGGFAELASAPSA